MGLGTELPLLLAIGFVVLGPKRTQTMLGHVARAKAQLEEARRGLRSQLAVELDATHQEGRTDASHESVGE